MAHHHAASFKALNLRLLFCWPRTRHGANIRLRDGLAPMGQGHNATTVKKPTVVPAVVGYLPFRSRRYALPTTPQRQNPHIHMYMRTRAHIRHILPLWPLCRCAFLYLFDNQEEKKGSGHNGATTVEFSTVVGCLKPLKNLDKGGFCHG